MSSALLTTKEHQSFVVAHRSTQKLLQILQSWKRNQSTQMEEIPALRDFISFLAPYLKWRRNCIYRTEDGGQRTNRCFVPATKTDRALSIRDEILAEWSHRRTISLLRLEEYIRCLTCEKHGKAMKKNGWLRPLAEQYCHEIRSSPWWMQAHARRPTIEANPASDGSLLQPFRPRLDDADTGLVMLAELSYIHDICEKKRSPGTKALYDDSGLWTIRDRFCAWRELIIGWTRYARSPRLEAHDGSRLNQMGVNIAVPLDRTLAQLITQHVYAELVRQRQLDWECKGSHEVEPFPRTEEDWFMIAKTEIVRAFLRWVDFFREELSSNLSGKSEPRWAGLMGEMRRCGGPLSHPESHVNPNRDADPIAQACGGSIQMIRGIVKVRLATQKLFKRLEMKLQQCGGKTQEFIDLREGCIVAARMLGPMRRLDLCCSEDHQCKALPGKGTPIDCLEQCH